MLEYPEATRLLRLVAGALLGLWALAGVVHSVAALVPATEARLEGESPPTVGVPTAMTPAVEAVRALLPADASEGPQPWLVVLPPDSPLVFQIYMRYQLAYLEFPRVVRVITAGETAGAAPYGGIIAASAIQLPGWEAVARRGGFVRYRPNSR